jgi:Fe-S cluster assembly iron-binding protein IscA
LGLALDELQENQQVHTINEIDLLIEESILPLTQDRQVNYIDNEYGQGFSIGAASGASC